MSTGSIQSLTQTTANIFPQMRSLIVGDAQCIPELQEIFERGRCRIHPIPDPLLPVIAHQQAHLFSRDFQVELLDGSILLPYIIQDRFLSSRFHAAIPQHLRHLSERGWDGYGWGVLPKFSELRETKAIREGEETRQGRSSIEGGNCFLCRLPNGEPLALIGKTTLYLTLLGLEEQNFFTGEVAEKIEKEMHGIDTPSEEFLLMARNLDISQQMVDEYQRPLREIDERLQAKPYSGQEAHSQLIKRRNELKEMFAKRWGNDKGYNQLLASPLTEQDRQKYLKQAVILQVRLATARRVIAQDVQIPEEAIAWLDQDDFHIDMQLTVDPSKAFVYLNDPEVALTSLEGISEFQYLRQTWDRVEAYEKCMQARCASRKKTMESIATAVKSIGCTVVPVPGIFEGSEVSPINFMNGFFVPSEEGQLFVTNGTIFRELQERFREAMRRANPSLRVDFLDVIAGQFSEDFLKKKHGGIHCLTRGFYGRRIERVHPTSQ